MRLEFDVNEVFYQSPQTTPPSKFLRITMLAVTAGHHRDTDTQPVKGTLVMDLPTADGTAELVPPQDGEHFYLSFYDPESVRVGDAGPFRSPGKLL